MAKVKNMQDFESFMIEIGQWKFELGQMKQHTRGYEQNTFDRLLFDQQRSSLLLNELTATLWDAKNPASPPP